MPSSWTFRHKLHLRLARRLYIVALHTAVWVWSADCASTSAHHHVYLQGSLDGICGTSYLSATKVNALLHAAWHDKLAQALLALLFSPICKLQDLGYAGTAKIADVGLARIMQHTMSNTATGDPAGTFAYAAPEMLMGEKWDDKVGCSLSVCLYVHLCVSPRQSYYPQCVS